MDETSRTLINGKTPNIRSNDIIFELKPRDGGAASTSGLIDKALFTGGNRLHAIMDTQTCLWSLKYESGKVPPVFQQRFTSFSKVHRFVQDYFDRRNVEITNVID